MPASPPRWPRESGSTVGCRTWQSIIWPATMAAAMGWWSRAGSHSRACGTRIVASTHGAPQDLVHEGVTGELCAPEDPRSLAEACVRAFDLARRPQTIATCRASAELFDWDLGVAPLCERLYLGA